MLNILYEDKEIIVAVKPAGVEAQAARRFSPDMVSELRKHLVMHKMYTQGQEPYVGVIHRLDKPVSGVMVYGKTKNAASKLSRQLREGKMKKSYHAVVWGKPVENVDNLVDYLKKSVDGNYSQVVDKGIKDAKRAELSYRLAGSCGTGAEEISLLEIRLMTGRHHQIRVQCAAHGFPLWGDQKYGRTGESGREEGPLALCASGLTFFHPSSGKKMEFSIRPSGGIFEKFFPSE